MPLRDSPRKNDTLAELDRFRRMQAEKAEAKQRRMADLGLAAPALLLPVELGLELVAEGVARDRLDPSKLDPLERQEYDLLVKGGTPAEDVPGIIFNSVDRDVSQVSPHLKKVLQRL